MRGNRFGAARQDGPHSSDACTPIRPASASSCPRRGEARRAERHLHRGREPDRGDARRPRGRRASSGRPRRGSKAGIVRILERAHEHDRRPLRDRRRRASAMSCRSIGAVHRHSGAHRDSRRRPSPTTWWSWRSRAGRPPRAGRPARVVDVLGQHRRARRRHADHHPQVRHSRRRTPRRRSRRRGASAARSSERDTKGRTDFRGVTTVTIDGEHARDFDDAITLERLPNGHLLARRAHRRRVALREGGQRARRGGVRARHVGLLHRARGAHVPVRARDGALQPQPARRSAGAVVPDGSGSHGHVVRYEMHDGVINSDARMTYTAVNAILDRPRRRRSSRSISRSCRCSS